MSHKKQSIKKQANSCSSLGWSSCTENGGYITATSTSSVENIQKHVACKVSVTCDSVVNAQIPKTGKHTKFFYNSNVKAAHIEALLARKRKGYYTRTNVNPIIYSSVYRANVNPACDTDCHGKRVYAAQGIVQQISRAPICHASNASAKVHVKHTPMDKAGEPNVKQANVKQVCESKQANVKQACESKPNVKPLCFDNVVGGLSSSSYVTIGEDFCQTSQDRAQVRSDLTAKVISSQGVSMDVDRSKM